MNKTKRKSSLLALLTAAALLSLSLTACGESEESTADSPAETEQSSVAETEPEAETPQFENEFDLSKSAFPKDEDGYVVLKGLADLVPHAEILEYAEPELERRGVKVDVVETASDATWYEKVYDEEVAFNYVAHWPYVVTVNEDNGFDLANAGNIHVEPISAYSERYSDVSEIPDDATFIIPNDATNEYRALKIIAEAGFITLSDEAEQTKRASVADITEYIKPIDITEIDSIQIIGRASEFDVYITNTNKALEAGVDTTSYLFREGEDSPYANIILTREKYVDDPAFLTLKSVLQSDDVRNWIYDHYNGAVIPAKLDSSSASSAAPSDENDAAETPAAEFDLSASVFEHDGDYVILKGLADVTPHNEIIEYAAPALEKLGVKVDVVETAADATWDEKVYDGEVDFHFDAHWPWVNSVNEINGFDLANAGNIHVEPISAYSEKWNSVDEVPDDAKIIIPNDPTNEFRALSILEDAGFIKLSDDAKFDLAASVADITEYVKPVEITEIDSIQIVGRASEFDIFITNTNKALEAGIDTTGYLFRESENSPYANVICVKEANVNDPAIKALVSVLQSDDVRDWISGHYNGAVIPAKQN